MSFDRARARHIVQLAADTIQNKGQVESWLRFDEKGTWEKQALEDLEETAAQAAKLGMSEAAVDKEITRHLQLLALTATRNSILKGKKSGRKTLGNIEPRRGSATAQWLREANPRHSPLKEAPRDQLRMLATYAENPMVRSQAWAEKLRRDARGLSGMSTTVAQALADYRRVREQAEEKLSAAVKRARAGNATEKESRPLVAKANEEYYAIVDPAWDKYQRVLKAAGKDSPGLSGMDRNSEQSRRVRHNVAQSRRARWSTGHQYPEADSPFWKHAAFHQAPLPQDTNVSATVTFTRAALKRKDCSAVASGISHLRRIARDYADAEGAGQRLNEEATRALQGLTLKQLKVCVRPQEKAWAAQVKRQGGRTHLDPARHQLLMMRGSPMGRR